MGFEQLAALRDELAARAAQARQAGKADGSQQKKQTSGQSKPSDGARQGQAGQSTKPASGQRPHQPAPGKSRGRPDGRRPDARRQESRKTSTEHRPVSGQEGTAQRGRRDAAPQPDIDPVLLAISRLQRHFPAAFPKKPAAKVPLKLGIHKELYERKDTLGLTEEQIKLAIATWCKGSRYWACLTQGADRLGLDGQPAGTVAEADEKRARQLAGRRQAQASKARRNKAAAATDEAKAGTDLAAEAMSASVEATAIDPSIEPPASAESGPIAESNAETIPASTDSTDNKPNLFIPTSPESEPQP